MRPFIPFLLLTTLAAPALAGTCGSIVASVCTAPIDAEPGEPPARKVLKVAPMLTPYVVGDRFPVESQSLLMDPARYGLKGSDGTWRYYALDGVVYRIDSASGAVLEVIRSRHTAHLR